MTRCLTLELPDDVADDIAQAIDPAAFVVDAIHLLSAESRFSEENIAEFDREFDKRTEKCRERMQDPKVRADLAALWSARRRSPLAVSL